MHPPPLLPRPNLHSLGFSGISRSPSIYIPAAGHARWPPPPFIYRYWGAAGPATPLPPLPLGLHAPSSLLPHCFPAPQTDASPLSLPLCLLSIAPMQSLIPAAPPPTPAPSPALGGSGGVGPIAVHTPFGLCTLQNTIEDAPHRTNAPFSDAHRSPAGQRRTPLGLPMVLLLIIFSLHLPPFHREKKNRAERKSPTYRPFHRAFSAYPTPFHRRRRPPRRAPLFVARHPPPPAGRLLPPLPGTAPVILPFVGPKLVPYSSVLHLYSSGPHGNTRPISFTLQNVHPSPVSPPHECKPSTAQQNHP